MTFEVLGVPIDCLGFQGPLQAVERMPQSLRMAGLPDKLGARDRGDLGVRIRDRQRDRETGVIGLQDCKAVTAKLRNTTLEMLSEGTRPFFVGGCCTMSIGIACGMRDHFGRAAVVYVDGHLDLYDGATSWQGEMADMPMAIMLGHGPASAMRDVTGAQPLRPEDAYIVGFRDREEALARGSLMPEDMTPRPNDISLEEMRSKGMRHVGCELRHRLEAEELPFYLHLDLDVLDEEILPATSYHLPHGMDWTELAGFLAPLVESSNLAAVSIGCYDPVMDEGEVLAESIAENIGRVFSGPMQKNPGVG